MFANSIAALHLNTEAGGKDSAIGAAAIIVAAFTLRMAVFIGKVGFDILKSYHSRGIAPDLSVNLMLSVQLRA